MSEKPTYEELESRVSQLEEIIENSIEEPGYSELSYRSLIEQLPHEVHIWTLVRDEQGNITTWKLNFANTAALKSWDRKLADVVDKTTDEIFPDSKATELFMPVVQKYLQRVSHYFGKNISPEPIKHCKW